MVIEAGRLNVESYNQLNFLNEDDPVKLLSSSNYLDQLVPIIKSSIQNNSVAELVQKLKTESGRKDDEIFAVLNENEENIATSVEDIHKVSEESSTISDQILDINDHISRISTLTIDKKFELLTLKKNINKINESEIIINKVLQVLELTDKTHELIKENKFFNALKNLNDLNDLIKDFDKEFKFLNHIEKSVPVLKQLIQDESLGLLKRNLTSLDSKFETYSNTYFDAYSAMIERWDLFKSKFREYQPYKINSSVEVSLRTSYTSFGLPQTNNLVAFDFIYDTYLIFKTLDQVQFFKNELNKELSIRRERALYPFVPSDSQNIVFKDFIKNEENLTSFLARLTGYLIFHFELSKRFPSLIKQTTNDQWENISAKVYPYLKNLILNEVFEIQKVISLKRVIGHFCLILENFSLSDNHFYNLLILLFKKYSSLSAFKFDKDFKDLANEDESMPMIIYELGLYQKITHICWFEDSKSPDQLEFPIALPFSTIYPMTCAQVRNYMSQQTMFLKDYHKYELPALNRLIVENIDALFLNSINTHYRERFDSMTREELAQNLINLEYFIIMTKEVARILSDQFETEITLKSTKAISDTRSITETKLYEVVQGKIDDLIEFIDWDWETGQLNKEPNFFIKDIGDFLINMFNSTFKNLPFSVRTLLLYRVFDQLTARFFENLNLQYSITKAAVHNFDLDIAYIENITSELSPTYLSSEAKPTNGTSRESLQSMFLQLKQVISLLKSGDLEEYKDQGIRNRKYDQVKPEIAVQLINKIENGKVNSAQPSPNPQSTSSASKIFTRFRNGGS